MNVFDDEIEGDVVATGWTVENDASLTSGAWEQAVPIGTFFSGQPAAPNSDATPSPGTMAFVTENSSVINEPYGANDVDGGPTRLVSPIFDLQDSDAFVSYKQWMFHDQIGAHDVLRVEVSNDGGGSWTLVESVTTTGSVWQSASFTVSDYVTPTSQVRVRFSIADEPNDSVAEAGIDDFSLDELSCTATCLWDLDNSGNVGVTDLLDLLGQWGTDPGGPPDFNGDGNVDVTDLLALLGVWGEC